MNNNLTVNPKTAANELIHLLANNATFSVGTTVLTIKLEKTENLIEEAILAKSANIALLAGLPLIGIGIALIYGLITGIIQVGLAPTFFISVFAGILIGLPGVIILFPVIVSIGYLHLFYGKNIERITSMKLGLRRQATLNRLRSLKNTGIVEALFPQVTHLCIEIPGSRNEFIRLKEGESNAK